MPSKPTQTDWNELRYISWREFRKMTPPIIKLEIDRVGKLLEKIQAGSENYNTLVKSRYELSQFVKCLEQAQFPPLNEKCTGHLSKAILNLSFKDTDDTSEEIHYVLDRLKHVYDRIGMIY
jgi:hypothetical protein